MTIRIGTSTNIFVVSYEMRVCFVFRVRPRAPSKRTSSGAPMHKTDALGSQQEYIIHSSIEKNIISLVDTECVQ